jgi:DNA-binding response OmpR family regulator
MRVLIAEDDAVARRLLQGMLTKWGYEVVVASDGSEALFRFQQPDAPTLAVLDWQMPGMSGVEVCRQVRATEMSRRSYILILTSKGSKADIVAGLEGGADDYLTKPFDHEELRARLHVGVRILQLQSELADRVHQLETALANVRLLQGLLPICCYCKKVRNDSNYWQQVETYIMEHSSAQFSHGICPDCYESVVKPELESLRNKDRETCCGHK